LAQARVRPADVGYIEVNGSGSEITDLLELKAIESVYRGQSTAECHLGSIKPNIGHPLLAEGIASFVKVVLMLHHRQRVPFLSAEQPMRHYDLGASPFRFSRTLAAWEEASRIAGINCFADGGTNAHAVVAAADAPETAATRRPLPPPEWRRVDLRRSGVASEPENGSYEVAADPGFWMRVTATIEHV
jgi:acyl transferase domain-containing protein